MPYDPDKHGPKRIVGPGFNQKVYALVEQVPAGRVTTYGDVAGALGMRRVARQVGFALAALRDEAAITTPWHRVINSQGKVSFRGDDWRGSEQVARLEREGVVFEDTGKVRDFKALRWAFDAPEL